MALDSGSEDGRTFDQLYRSCYVRIVQYEYRRTLDMGVAEELAQEVFLIAWRRWDRAEGGGLPWLYGVARRVLANYVKSGRSGGREIGLHEIPDVDLWDGKDQFGFVDHLHDVVGALSTLSADDREVLLLAAWERLTVTEISQALGCNRGAAAVRLHRARRRLERRMAAGPGLGRTADRQADALTRVSGQVRGTAESKEVLK
ncbi:RNA polymerase sigma factor [Phytohabitans aurantiacus]|uniref:RNA polymerase sigma factor n=1 Tax=Phytohabitans aurantiacus TaxID=3016789 RepID=UPI0024925227|nr:sigma-70 family RNA polymerase sigma factor [Phytohabitans aurantiacus]